jgi:hypothetical protein
MNRCVIYVIHSLVYKGARLNTGENVRYALRAHSLARRRNVDLAEETTGIFDDDCEILNTMKRAPRDCK